MRARSCRRAGLAATILPASMVGPGLKILGRAEGLPELPLTRMGLIHAPGRPSEEAMALGESIRQTLGLGEVVFDYLKEA